MSTLLIFVSITGSGRLYAKAQIDADVYGHIPGSSKSVSREAGITQLWSETITWAAFCKRNALLLNHSHDRNESSVILSHSASSCSVGRVSIKAKNFGITLSTCVCWDITSLTNTRYGSKLSLHGKSLLCSSYRQSIFFWNILIFFSEISIIIIFDKLENNFRLLSVFYYSVLSSFSDFIFITCSITSFRHPTLIIWGSSSIYAWFRGVSNNNVGIHSFEIVWA